MRSFFLGLAFAGLTLSSWAASTYTIQNTGSVAARIVEVTSGYGMTGNSVLAAGATTSGTITYPETVTLYWDALPYGTYDWYGSWSAMSASGAFSVAGSAAWSASGTATFTFGGPPPAPDPWKYKRKFENITLQTLRVTVTAKNSAGAVVGTQTEDVRPGASVEFVLTDWTAPGTIEWSYSALQGDGVWVSVAGPVDGPSSSNWQQIPVATAPTAGPVINPATGGGSGAPVDTKSKTTGSIDFAAGSNAAKDETLKTGFSALRSAIGETAAQTQAAIAAQGALDRAKDDIGNGLLGDIKDRLSSIISTNNASKSLVNAQVSSWTSGASSEAGSVYSGGTNAGARIGQAISVLSAVPDLAPSATPSTWSFDFGAAGTVDLNPRQLWVSGSAADSIRIWARLFASVVCSLGVAYAAGNLIFGAVRDLAHTQQVQAPNGAEGLVSLVSIPAYVAATAALYLVLAAGVGLVFSTLWGKLVLSASAYSLPTVVSEILSVGNEWVPVVLKLSLAVSYGLLTLTVHSVTGLAVTIRSLLPAS